ncbi:MAG: glutamine amidotransferase [Acidimicrobiia bacterium]|nr:glutamine amidotransferase [Acidimicrobiia bacterium]
MSPTAAGSPTCADTTIGAGIKICHLYPQLMNIYADRGNIAVLRHRMAERGLKSEVVEIGLTTPIPDDCNLYYLGGGQDRDQLAVSEDLTAKAEPLLKAAANGAVVLGVCGGYQLLGHSYTSTKEFIAGIGLLDLETTADTNRLVGDVVAEVTLNGKTQIVVGYENHAGRTHLGPGCTPLALLQQGHGNNSNDGGEGAVSGKVLGTYLHGPLLPKNPWLADTLLAWALEHARNPVKLTPLNDQLENAAHEVAKTRTRRKK